MERKTGEIHYNKIIIFLLIVCSAIALGSYLDIPDNYTRRQVRTVICAKEMIASGNYIIPTLGGTTRFRKPPLPYWLISLTAKLNHNQVTNITSRLPSVLAGILILLLAWWWTYRIHPNGNQKTALLSPLILAFVPLFYLDARSSEAEIVLCFFIMAASYFFWKASLTTKTSGKNLMVAYLFVAGGFLTKGPLALIMPLLPYAVIQKRNFLKEWKWHLLGLFIAIIPVGLWVLATYIYYPGSIDIFIKELFTKRFGGGAKHVEPFYYYVILFLSQFAVFVPIVLLTNQKIFAIKRETKFLLYFVVLNFIWLSVMASKQRHYIIPLLPQISILLGVWLSEVSDRPWVERYFYVISWVLAVGVFFLGWSLIPQSISILIAVIAVSAIVLLYSRYFVLRGLWLTAIFFLALMHLANVYVTISGNRLLYEKLMVNWIQNQPINKQRVRVINKPEALLAFYLDSMNTYIHPQDKDAYNKADYYIIEENKKLYERYIKDSRYYPIKTLEKIRKSKRENKIALFGKIDSPGDNIFQFRLLFLSDIKGKDQAAWVDHTVDPKTLYAIVPEINPLVNLGFFSIGSRMKFNQRYLPLVSQGVELICKLDPRSSIFRKAWFNDVSYWGVTPDNLQQRTFFNGRYSLWTIDVADIDTVIASLEEELRMSPSKVKFVFFQKSSSSNIKIPMEYNERIKKLGVMIVNEFVTGEIKAVDINIGYDELTIKTLDSTGSIVAVLKSTDSGMSVVSE